jgi:hypothetical protein
LTPLSGDCFNQIELYRPERLPVELLPDLSTVSDDELTLLLAQREAEEDAISKRRRLLHGRIDILRGERTSRLKAQVAAGGGADFPSPTSLDRPLYAGTGDVSSEDALMPLPDLAAISGDDLRTMIRALEHEEDDISLNRRFLQGQVDILRAERAKRSRDSGGGHVNPGDLGPILRGGPAEAA